MALTVQFHDDPRQVECAPCVDPYCEDDHVTVTVRGESSVEQFSCEHGTHVVVWHALTLADHPEPVCSHGCVMRREVLG